MRRVLGSGLVVLALAAAWPLAAQQGSEPAQASYAAASGDAWIDAQLADINRYAERYPESFIDEVVRYAGISDAYVRALLTVERWPAADIYMACFWGKVSGSGCRPVVRAFALDRAGGWQAALARLPVAPERAQWRALRQAVMDSYAHWDRPLAPDPAPRRQRR